MRVCSVHGSLDHSLRELGHEVLALRPGPGVFALDQELSRRDFAPDLVVQQETLGPRTLLSGLETLPCPRVYWSIDTHLNSFWQSRYGRLFDLVLTTQRGWTDRLKTQGLTRVDWLPWHGFEHPWTPWERRAHDVAFVGRVTGHRPVRQALVRFIQEEFAAHVVQDLSFPDMVRTYADTRLAPNESILGEVNFRTFETASCGCLAVCQALGQDLEALFTPGQEILTYDHGLDLRAALRFGLDRPEAARRMGAAARDRVLKEHLPGHRARRLLDLARTAPGQRLGRHQAQAAWWLTQTELWQAGRCDLPGEVLLSRLLAIPLNDEILAAILRLTSRLKGREGLTPLLAPILAQGQYRESWQVNLAGSMAGLRAGSLELARQFWYRQIVGQAGRTEAVASPLELLLAWSRELVRLGQDHRPGFVFDPTEHLPASGLECLVEAHGLAPGDLVVQRRLNGLLGRFRGTEQIRLGLLSHLGLHDPDNWRDGLELAMVNLRVFRIRPGLEEAMNALDTARRAGQEQRFWKLLQGMDPDHTLGQAIIHLKGNAPAPH